MLTSCFSSCSEELCTGLLTIDRVARDHEQVYPGSVMLVKYEDFILTPDAALAAMFRFMGEQLAPVIRAEAKKLLDTPSMQGAANAIELDPVDAERAIRKVDACRSYIHMHGY